MLQCLLIGSLVALRAQGMKFRTLIHEFKPASPVDKYLGEKLTKFLATRQYGAGQKNARLKSIDGQIENAVDSHGVRISKPSRKIISEFAGGPETMLCLDTWRTFGKTTQALATRFTELVKGPGDAVYNNVLPPQFYRDTLGKRGCRMSWTQQQIIHDFLLMNFQNGHFADAYHACYPHRGSISRGVPTAISRRTADGIVPRIQNGDALYDVLKLCRNVDAPAWSWSPSCKKYLTEIEN